MKLEDVTEQLLKDADMAGKVWLRDDWLSMRSYETDPDKLAVYDKIAEVKERMLNNGYIFKCDKI